MNTENPKIASAGDFLKMSGKSIVELPDSKLTVKLRDSRPNAAFLASNHYLSAEEVTGADTEESLLFLCAYVAAMFVEPSVYNDSSEAAAHWENRDAVPLSALTDNDFSFVQGIAFPEGMEVNDDETTVTEEDSFRADSTNEPIA